MFTSPSPSPFYSLFTPLPPPPLLLLLFLLLLFCSPLVTSTSTCQQPLQQDQDHLLSSSSSSSSSSAPTMSATAAAASISKRIPPLFISHGGPNLYIVKDESYNFYRSLGDKIRAEYPNLRAVVVVSAHWDEDGPIRVNTSPNPPQVCPFFRVCLLWVWVVPFDPCLLYLLLLFFPA